MMYSIHQILRTQIYFPKDLYQELKTGAVMNNLSLSEYIRRILKEKIFSSKEKVKVLTKKGKPSFLVKKAISFGKKDVAKNFDKYFEASL